MRRKRRKTRVSYGSGDSDRRLVVRGTIDPRIKRERIKAQKAREREKRKQERLKAKAREKELYKKSKSLVLNKIKNKDDTYKEISSKKDIMDVLKAFKDFEMTHTDYRRENISYHEYENKVQDVSVMSQNDILLAINDAMSHLKKNGKLSKADKKFIRKYQRVVDPEYHKKQGYKTLQERLDEFESSPSTKETFESIIDDLKKLRKPIYDVMNKWKQSDYYIVISTYDTKGLQDYNAEYLEDVQISRFLDFLYREYGLSKQQIMEICANIGYNPEEHIKDNWMKRGKSK